MISFGRCLQWAAFVALILPIPMASAIGDEIDGAAETIVFVRHGEKPEGGFEQLNCQGLNRALALPSAIANSFGRPEAIFAPNPSLPKEDAGKLYDYIRPLATIEPTAIQFGLPVDVSVGFDDREGLQAALVKIACDSGNCVIQQPADERVACDGTNCATDVEQAAPALACQGNDCATEEPAPTVVACEGSNCAVEQPTDEQVACTGDNCAIEQSGGVQMACTGNDCATDDEPTTVAPITLACNGDGC